ncbi:MAG: glutaredoxin family protein [Planctomycetota bacterium]
MTIEVYSKEGCAICTAAKDKLRKLGLPFDSRDIDSTVVPHEGWRDDGSADVLAMYAMIDNHLPVIRIDGECTDYASAMRRLNRR